MVELNTSRLRRLGYEVVATTSSVEALDVFRRNADEFDLVITDQMMPGMTGMELATELLKVKTSVPIILYTGYAETVSSESAGEAGIKAILMKPLFKSEMAVAIRRVLDAKTCE